METIVRIKFPHIRYEEYPTYCYQLFKIINGMSPGALFLGRSFDEFSKLQPEIDKIVLVNKDTSDTQAIAQSDDARDALFTEIWNNVEAISVLLPSAIVSTATIERARLILNFLKRFGRSTTTLSYSAETERIREIKSLLSGSADVASAVEALDLKNTFDKLFAENENFDVLYLKRAKNIGAIEHVDVRAIRAVTDKTMTALFGAIEYNMHEHPEKDYGPLVREINALQSAYKAQIEKRASGNKSSATAAGGTEAN